MGKASFVGEIVDWGPITLRPLASPTAAGNNHAMVTDRDDPWIKVDSVLDGAIEVLPRFSHKNTPRQTLDRRRTHRPPQPRVALCLPPSPSLRWGDPHMGPPTRPYRKSHRIRRHLDDLTDDDPRRRQESPLSRVTPKYARNPMVQLTLGSFTCLVTVVTRQRGDALPKELRAPRSFGSRHSHRTAPGRADPRGPQAWPPGP